MLFYDFFKQNKRAAQGVKKALGVILVLFLFLSLFFIATEAHHECSGEECPICICLEECVRSVKGFCDSLLILSALSVVFIATVLCSFAESKELVFNTPILSKVRMNN